MNQQNERDIIQSQREKRRQEREELEIEMLRLNNQFTKYFTWTAITTDIILVISILAVISFFAWMLW